MAEVVVVDRLVWHAKLEHERSKYHLANSISDHNGGPIFVDFSFVGMEVGEKCRGEMQSGENVGEQKREERQERRSLYPPPAYPPLACSPIRRSRGLTSLAWQRLAEAGGSKKSRREPAEAGGGGPEGDRCLRDPPPRRPPTMGLIFAVLRGVFLVLARVPHVDLRIC